MTSIIRVGDIYTTTNGESMIVSEYKSATNVSVTFKEGAVVKTTSQNIRNGQVKNPYFPTVYGRGFIGVGIYSWHSHKHIYKIWYHLFERCYDLKALKRKPSYKGCCVDRTWYNFQIFASWFVDQIGCCKDWQIDKDILKRYNKRYGPDVCCLVPQEINNLFIKPRYKNSDMSIGVVATASNKSKPFMIRCNVKGKQKTIGYADSIDKGFLMYKTAKEAEIKRIAVLYKGELYPHVYKALICYEVMVTD